jgi:hypothetical protein
MAIYDKTNVGEADDLEKLMSEDVQSGRPF